MTRARPEQIQPARIERSVVAGEFHNRAEAIAGLHGCDGDAMLLEDEWDFRTARGPGHGKRISFAGLNRNLAAELEVESRGPGAGRDDENIGAHFSRGSLNGGRLMAVSNEAEKVTLFMNVDTSFDQ